MEQICPACGKGRIICETSLKKFEYKGAILEAEYSEEYCDACGSLMQSLNTIHHNQLKQAAAIEAFAGK